MQDPSILRDSTVILNAESVQYHPTSRSKTFCPVQQLVARPAFHHGATPCEGIIVKTQSFSD